MKETDLDNQIIVRPQNNVKIGIAKIQLLNNNYLIVKYIKDNDFIKIAKEKRLRWDGNVWGRQITPFTGNADDRAGEIGNSLLANGFTVEFYNSTVKEKAIHGNFEKEQTRWIKWNETQKQFVICWNEYNDELYQTARTLPGAKWNKGYMYVPNEFYKEVIDFAEITNFKFSDAANEEIKKCTSAENEYEIVSVIEKKYTNVSDIEKLKGVLNSSGTIISDLIDD